MMRPLHYPVPGAPSSNSILYNGDPGPLNGSQFGCQSWLTFSNIGDRGISLPGLISVV